MTSSDATPTPTHSFGRRGLLILDLVFFATAAIFVCLSPCGSWVNQVMGVKMWENTDPSGTYVASSLYFVGIDRYPTYIGHPGLTLQALIGVMARAMYTLHRINGAPGPFLGYCAKNLRGLFVMAGLLIAACHVVSFHALYAVAKRILEDARAALLAVLAYATLFPTLYFATRISVEPILVTLCLWTLLSLWNMQQALDRQRLGRACLWACLAASAAVAALFTKVHLAAPLLPLALLQLLFQRSAQRRSPRLVRAQACVAPHSGSPQDAIEPCPADSIVTANDENRPRHRFPQRLLLAGCYLACAAACFQLINLKFDWRFFFATWFYYTPGGAKYAPTEDVTQNYVSNAPAMAHNTWECLRNNWSHYTTFTNLKPEAIFTIAEGLFVILAIAGLVWLWASRPDKRGQLLWPLLYGVMISPVLAYRGLWHYFFLYLAFAAIFVAFFLWQLLARLRPSLSLPRRLAWSATAVLLIHSISIFFYFDTKKYDAAMYRQTLAPYHQALDKLRPPGLIAVITQRPLAVWKSHGIFDEWLLIDGDWRNGSRVNDLHAALDSYFVVVHEPHTLTRAWAAKTKVRFVIDLRRDKPAVIPIAKWSVPKAKPATQPETTPAINRDNQ